MRVSTQLSVVPMPRAIAPIALLKIPRGEQVGMFRWHLVVHARPDLLAAAGAAPNLLHTLRTIFDEWALCADHPARGQLLVGLAVWATDVRRRTGSQSAAQTAQRFARGETAVELYE